VKNPLNSMGRHMRRIPQLWVKLVIVLMALVGQLAQANDNLIGSANPASCEFENHIRKMGQEIIDYRATLKGFSSRHFGSDAIYLLLHYTDPTAQKAQGLLERLSSDGRIAHNGESLKAAYELSQLNESVDFVFEHAKILDLFIDADKHVLRAVVLGDSGLSYFTILKKIRIDPALNTRWEKSKRLHRRLIPRLLLDQSDEVRTDIAEQALKANEDVMAARIFASLKDLSRYHEVINQYTEDSEFYQLAGPMMVTSYGTTLQNHVERIPGVDVSNPIITPGFYKSFRASYLSAQFDFLLYFLNDNLRQPIVSPGLEQASEFYLTQLEAGKVVPAYDAEVYWFALYEALLMFVDRDVVHRVLNTFFVGKQHRHFSVKALHLLDWVVAKRAIFPFLSIEIEKLPEHAKQSERPMQLSDNFDWNLWIKVAKDVRKGRVEYAEASEARIALELYALMDEYDTVITIAEHSFELKEQLTIYRDFMQRFDRRCKNVSDFPGRAVFMAGEKLYRFR